MPILNSSGFLTLDRKVELQPYQPRELIPFTEMTDDEIYSNNGDCVFDSECFPNYFLAAFKHLATGKIINLIPPFDPRKLSYILHRYTCIGFNSMKYDLPLLWAAYKNQDLSFLKTVSNDLVRGEWYQEVCKQHGIVIYPTSNVDLIEVCPNKGSLKLYAARLHVKRIQELPYHHMDTLSEQQKLIVTDYCIWGDLPATELLYKFNKDRLELRSLLSRKYGENLLSKSDAQMAEAIVIKELTRKTGKRPKKADLTEDYSFSYQPPAYLNFRTPQLQELLASITAHKFLLDDFARIKVPEFLKGNVISIKDFSCTFGIGGLHSKEKTVAYKAENGYFISDNDAASYYPRIISNLGLYPEHLGPIFLDVFNGMTDDRLRAKKLKQFAEDKGLKIAINGISGKYNSEHSVVFSPRCYVQMTLTGQLSILLLIEYLEYAGIKVINANTDGIVVYGNNYNLLRQIIEYWEGLVNFKTEETQYTGYYARDVNAYFAIKETGEVKVKGPYSEVGSQTGTQLDNNPIMLICSDAIKKMLSEGVEIDKTIRECKDVTRFVTVRNVKGGAHKNGIYLGKVVRFYYGKGELGTINYCETNNKVPMTEGAIPCLDLPDSFPVDIDHQRYIDEARSMLYDVGYLKRPEQVRFF